MKKLLCLVLLTAIVSCQKNYLADKFKFFREAIKTPFVESGKLPFVKNEFFSGFSQEDINQYRDLGINIWKKDDLFMRGRSDFITIYEVELKEDVLLIDYRYHLKGSKPVNKRIYFSE